MSTLSLVYDELLGDYEGIKQYFDFVKKQNISFPLLECACGSGDLLNQLKQLNSQVEGIDLDHAMIESAKKKYSLNVFVLDMCDLSSLPSYQTILCFGDSLNYLADLQLVKTFFSQVYNHLEIGGTFLFDTHSLDRLDEFREVYLEEGQLSIGQYQWTIETIESQLVHQFVFYVNQRMVIEQVVQTIFHPLDLLNILEECGFSVTIKTDFDKEGIQSGEKYFYICHKEAS